MHAMVNWEDFQNYAFRIDILYIITSFGNRTCTGDYPSVFMRIGPWILGNIPEV